MVRIPDNYNPWAPLDIAAEPNLLTGFKLRRAREDPARCMATLAQTGLGYEPVPDRSTGPGCGFENAVRVHGGRSLSLRSPVVLSCRAALSFAMWERHALQPAALQRLGEPLVGVAHFGSYACRNINTGEGGAQSGRRSRHATADALDVAGFDRGEGRHITVQHGWDRDDAEALFLRDAHAGACRFFDGVLGPGYNAVHADHFHLEVGGFHGCR
ncbi:MAG: extensin family protein [Variovorax sp.]|nr:MAG: extensin family protein [Variovorax sp.]